MLYPILEVDTNIMNKNYRYITPEGISQWVFKQISCIKGSALQRTQSKYSTEDKPVLVFTIAFGFKQISPTL